MKSTGKKSKTSGNTSGKSGNKALVNTRAFEIIRIVFIVLLSFFMFYPPFLKGLYFEENQLPAEIFVFIIFIAYSVFKLIRKDRRFIETPLDYAGLALVVLYFIPVILYLVGIKVAVAPRSAVLEWLKYCMYFSAFFMITELVTTLKTKLAFLWVIVGTASCVSIVGFDAAAGGHIISGINFFIKHITQVIKPDDVFVSNRIYSTIQYPNAFASYLLAVMFLSLTLTAVSSRLWVKAIGGACSVLFLISLVFTQSRGVLVIGLIPVLIFILALTRDARIKVVSLGAASVVSAIPVIILLYGEMMSATRSGTKIWLLLLLGIAVSAGLTILVSYFEGLIEKTWKILALVSGSLCIIGIIAGVFILNASTDLVLLHAENQPDSALTAVKGAAIKPGKDYKLVFDVDAKMKADKPEAYSIFVNYKREKDLVVNDRESSLAFLNGKATNGVETKEVKFSLPADSKIVNFYFRNTYQGTTATFKNVRVVDAVSGRTVEKLVLKHKYISEATVDKFSNMFQSRSFIERVIFLKDGLKMIKDRPILGAGGGAWENIYFGYQTFAYPSTQPHNYFIQIAVECGAFGILALLFLILSVISMFMTEYRFKIAGNPKERALQGAIFAGIIGLLIHSLFDFDFSLSAVFLVFWQLMGIFNSRYRNNPDMEKREYTQVFVNKALGVLNSLKGVKRINAHAGVIAVPVILILFIPLFITGARGYAKEAVELSRSDLEASISNMKKAAQSDPMMSQYKIDSTKLILSKQQKTAQDIDEVRKLLNSAEKLSWNNSSLIAKVGSQYITIADFDRGLPLFDRSTELKPLWPIEWQQKVGAYYSVVNYYIGEGKKDKAIQYIDNLKDIKEQAEKANKNNLNPFIFDQATDEYLGRLLYAKEKMQTLGKDDLGKLVFYGIVDEDINFDGVPDQWTPYGSINFMVNSPKGAVTVESKDTAGGSYIDTRSLGIAEKKKYRIELELLNKPASEAIPFIITGAMPKNESLKFNGTSYSAEISVPEGFKPAGNVLRIFVSGKYEIKGVKVIEI